MTERFPEPASYWRREVQRRHSELYRAERERRSAGELREVGLRLEVAAAALAFYTGSPDVFRAVAADVLRAAAAEDPELMGSAAAEAARDALSGARPS